MKNDPSPWPAGFMHIDATAGRYAAASFVAGKEWTTQCQVRTHHESRIMGAIRAHNETHDIYVALT